MSAIHTTRVFLFAGVSTLALSLGAAEVRAADLPAAPKPVLKAPPPPQVGVLTVWIQGAAIWTGGGENREKPIFSADGGLPGTAGFRPRVGWELAGGADYRFAASPWHASVDFRYGQSKAQDQNFFRSLTLGPPNGFVFYKSSARDFFQEHESHFAADFMIGHDVGIGLGPTQVKFGVKVADLHATLNEQSTYFLSFETNPNGPFFFALGQSASVRQRASFVGAGPRLAAEGSVPLGGPWGVDWAGGVAGLFGDRKFDRAFVSAGGGGCSGCPGFAFSTASTKSFNDTKAVFNADASLALAYWFTPRAKLSAGMQFDGYWHALKTFDATGGTAATNVVDINRFYWGPFLRLTGMF